MIAEAVFESTQRAVLSDITTKNHLIDYLNSLTSKLERRSAVRNVLKDVKKYLDDQNTRKKSLKSLSATAELIKTSVDYQELGKTFSNLENSR